MSRIPFVHKKGKARAARQATNGRFPLRDRNRPVLAALPSQFAVPIMCEVESLLSDAPLRIRVDGLESRRSYAET
jgi:hypothetical protein